MIAADANIFLRWLLDDDHAKAEQVATLFKRAEEGKVEVRAADLTLAEVVWVLGSFYELKPDAIADLLEPLLDSPVQFENRDRLMVAMELFRAHKASFGDCYLAAFAREKGAEIASYDRDFDKLAVKRVEP
ncbi:MAG: PIN domain nuclease [Elusimicrobia bacterium CG_4_9_14_3_um_filter_62_55]|nr:MAG: PIN domain nuclease [Elusimicrobia bacterium CG22_combo_CG10-13_8_21_14_all_63_91]PJA18515.1 MAG: PIN domain nuclease [Elusimicrobia bacterium CG_4_10_14_0_2_um_filter_63_34]PJB25497.1 MAG: PIN domain nuclease [Elusimicrobia bacterium CG_4_9_14_3_um_filter_62_55]